MKLTTKQLTLCAVLTALALAFSYLENFFPLSLAIPIPGIKLGLANIVTVFALYALGPAQALLILTGRCLLGAVFAGKHERPDLLPAGGLFRHAGDDFAVQVPASVHLRCIHRRRSGPQLRPDRGGLPDAGLNGAPLYYLPILLGASLITGAVTGVAAACLFRVLAHTNIFRVRRRRTFCFDRMERWLTFLQRGATLNLHYAN